jgi:murein DD-endopeptidase
MESLIKKLLFAFAFILNVSFSFGQAYRTTLNVGLPESVNFININNKQTAYYELHLTNFSTDTFKLKDISVTDLSGSLIYLSKQGDELKNSYREIGSQIRDSRMRLKPGSSGIVYIELSIQKQQIKQISHRIVFEVTVNEKSEEVTIQTSATKCSSLQLVLDAPLKDGIWAAIYEPSWDKGHRRVVYTLNGKARIPGRYAIDFIKIDSNGKYVNGDENLIKNWLGYGVDVVAVADGIVSSIGKDFAESQTLSEHPKYSADKATGNYISLKIGNNQFAFYEHLQPNSIKVKVGQKVRKGDVIGSLGFTGQTNGPHLHFHVADTDSPLGAEGIPFVFKQFQFLGSYETFKNFGKTIWTEADNLNESNRKDERPKPNAVIRFSSNQTAKTKNH